MKGYSEAREFNMDNYITQEMRDYFKKRTDKHINLVQKYCNEIYKVFPDQFKNIVRRGEIHDASKYGALERGAYIILTWNYKCKDDNVKFNIPEDIRSQMKDITKMHVYTNNHHPECHCGGEDEGLLNATNMTPLDIAEMIADWCAMSEEKGNNPKDWADNTVNIKWKFTDDQTKLIYELIDRIWGD